MGRMSYQNRLAARRNGRIFYETHCQTCKSELSEHEVGRNCSWCNRDWLETNGLDAEIPTGCFDEIFDELFRGGFYAYHDCSWTTDFKSLRISLTKEPGLHRLWIPDKHSYYYRENNYAEFKETFLGWINPVRNIKTVRDYIISFIEFNHARLLCLGKISDRFHHEDNFQNDSRFNRF